MEAGAGAEKADRVAEVAGPGEILPGEPVDLFEIEPVAVFEQVAVGAAQLANPTLALIPVVVVTAAGHLNDGARTLSSVEALAKPFALEVILPVVARYAALRERA